MYMVIFSISGLAAMGFIVSVINSLIKWTLYTATFVAFIVLLPGLPPKAKFTYVTITPPRPAEGVLAPNGALNNAEVLFNNKLHGPECFDIYNGELYTSLHGGEIVKVSSKHLAYVAKVGKQCEGFWQESKCGRPLGFRFDKSGTLYVSDAFYGIWKVNPTTGKNTVLVPAGSEIEGRVPKLFNSVALAANGDFYWTDSSSDFSLDDLMFSMLADSSGRLFHYNAATNTSRVLLDGLWFANGVALSPNEEFVIVAESVNGRIGKVYVNGPKKGETDIFVDGLPGSPDNIQVLADGSGVLVGIPIIPDAENPLLTYSLAPLPYIRKFLSRTLALISLPFEYANQYYPHRILEKITHIIGHFEMMKGLLPKKTGILKVNWDGEIVGAWYNTDGSVTAISDAIVFENYLYLGSPFNRYVARVPVPENLKSEQNARAGAKLPSQKPIAEKVQAAETQKQPQATPKKTEAPTTTTQAQPKVVQKPKPTQEPKPTEAPKPVTPAPKAATQAPKPATETPKPATQAPKPATQAPKPTTQASKTAPQVPKPASQAPKPATEAPKPAAQVPKPATQVPKQKPEAPKPAVTQPPKQAEPEKPKATPKKVTETNKAAPKKAEAPKKDVPSKPIIEEIPSDTVVPIKEPLKVIRKEGPAEIPNPAAKK